MGTSIELKTISSQSRGAKARKYDDGTDDISNVKVAFAALILTAAAFARTVLWGSAAPIRPDEEPAETAGDDGANCLKRPVNFAISAPDDQEDWEEPAAEHSVPLNGESVNFRSTASKSGPDAPLMWETPGSGVRQLKAGNDNVGQDHSSISQNPVPLGFLPASLPGAGGPGGTPSIGTAPADSTSGSRPTPASAGTPEPENPGTSPGINPAPPATDGGNPPDRNRNSAPVVIGSVVLPGLSMNHAVVIALTDLLQHASDPDGDSLDLTGLTSSSGLLSDNRDHTWTFTPVTGDSSEVTFSYLVTDGEQSVAQSAFLDLLPGVNGSVDAGANSCGQTLLGGAGDDVIVGTTCNDSIDGGSGNDLIYADDGSDIIYGGNGNDVIDGGNGNDIIHAGTGNDVVFAGKGNDIVFAEDGDDVVFAGSGDDIVLGGTGEDLLIGDEGNDIIDAGSGNDTIVAGDVASPSASPIAALLAPGIQDSLDSGRGIEPIVAKSLTGVSADGATAAIVSDGNDILDGGTGIDTYDLSHTTTGVVIDLSAGRASGQEIGQDILNNIENVTGGSGNDLIVDSAARNVLTGGDGSDTFVFVGNDDEAHLVGQLDQITDFTTGDIIDISRIDAYRERDGQQEFTFGGKLTDDPREVSLVGQLNFKFTKFEDGEHTIIIGRTSEDEGFDFIIDLLGEHEMVKGDFHGLA